MAVKNISTKKTQFGNNRSKSLRATRRTWKPNYQTTTITDENGVVKRVKLSAREIKRLKLERK